MSRNFILTCLLFLTQSQVVFGQKERMVHYWPQGNDFVCEDGKLRFNRALYGTNTAFRVEAGDLPEFAMYMPGMGGNLRFALMNGNNRKWLIEVQKIKAIYRADSMLYEIKDALLGNGKLFISVLALSDAEGMVIKIKPENTTGDVQLVWLYGGASGKKFSRDGDIGADPESSFYLKAENCIDNRYQVLNGKFILIYGTGKVLTKEERYEIQTRPESQLAGEVPKDAKKITGFYPSSSSIRLIDASNPEMIFNPVDSAKKDFCISGKLILKNADEYFLLHNSVTPVSKTPEQEFNDAEIARKKLADRIRVNTPDKYLNTLGGALSVAADAIWEEPTYMHGAVAWRMRLPGWRGAYVADPLGWHDRARTHFDAYAKSQLTNPATSGVVTDTSLNLARHMEKVGTQLFSEGYITRNPNGYIGAHHYDMNLVFIDQLLNHFNYTGDTSYVKKMWPLLKRHLAWEKKNFDADGDGLYDAYAAIWASDALQYSGGGVTHSSAYDYRANKMAAGLANLIGEDATPYKNEANKIFAAVQKELWLPRDGWYAEYKDLLGKQLVHPFPGIWSIYQALDSKLSDDFQAYQSLRYIDNFIPHIPVKAKGFEKNLYLLASTNWQPYTWSINNVALAENLHTSLAYWRGNRPGEAFKLWRSILLESMYLSSSPGGFEQLSLYDAVRGELYRDFADGVGMAGRTLVEGLFGIQPNALHDSLTIKPGYPSNWKFATLHIPDLQFDFKRTGNTDNYFIKQFFGKHLNLRLLLSFQKDNISSILLNGKPVKWKIVPDAVGTPLLELNIPAAAQFKITINWKGNPVSNKEIKYEVTYGKQFSISLPGVKITELYDPQEAINKISISQNRLIATPRDNLGAKTIFLKVKQGITQWWQPVHLLSMPYFNLKELQFDSLLVAGFGESVYEKQDLSSYFNDKVINIFKHQYLSPRPTSPTLQLPTQGIGNWCYPLITANIDDSGLRKLAGADNEIRTSEDIPFAIASDTSVNNILFTSQWDNFPDSATIPLSGKAKEVYLLMAGSTNPMQSRITNGLVTVNYADGSKDTLLLNNPQNWWPIEQDYMNDSMAFSTGNEIPERLYLKEGKFARGLKSYSSIKGFSNKAIDGGAATVLNMFVDNKKTLQSLSVYAVANDVVIGLMALTLIR